MCCGCAHAATQHAAPGSAPGASAVAQRMPPPCMPPMPLQVWLVLGDCTLIGLAPVLVHMAKDAQGHYAFRRVRGRGA